MLIHLAFMKDRLVQEIANPVSPLLDDTWHSADLWLVFLAVTLNFLVIASIALYFCHTSRIITAPLNQGRDMKQDLSRAI